jgi:hypothetical protein
LRGTAKYWGGKEGKGIQLLKGRRGGGKEKRVGRE